ncbi:hypothetical protein [Caballeronia novacaledonica]|uniref:Uncharacterized protein n=1 Tax=Caballeronia novacaledonica TaxID=1544861 RepID=A0AA37IF12_9BURK|nr:hypothetical protein [Caballeronia novacaledonica]GJH28148.1 hypothetical protein CBA19CS42_26550 [Caballeronia novacaledonica]
MNSENKPATARVIDAMGSFVKQLDSVPGWRDARVENMMLTMDLDDMFERPQAAQRSITLPLDIEKQHTVVMRYLELADCTFAFKSCEYYFRRFPFNDLPVSRHEHLSNVCELYFSRLYQFKERLKLLSDAMEVAVPSHGLTFGSLIKRFAKEFDQELRERNQIHHTARFSDLDTQRLFLTVVSEMANPGKGWKAEQTRYYRKVSKEWAQRVRDRAALLDAFLEAVAEGLLDRCAFLSPR